MGQGGQKERANQHTWDLVSWAVVAVEMLTNQSVDAPPEAVQILNEQISQDIDPEISNCWSKQYRKTQTNGRRTLINFSRKLQSLQRIGNVG